MLWRKVSDKIPFKKTKKTMDGVEKILTEERQFSESKVLERCNWTSNRDFSSFWIDSSC